MQNFSSVNGNIMKKLKLKEIADISSGYQFRKRPPEFSSGEIRYIQMRDVNDSNEINMDSVIFIDLDESSIQSKQLLENDILFKNRGSINNAAVFNIEEVAIASHQFQIIRLNSNIILPQYLHWYLNHTIAQSYFKSNAAGTATPIIQKKVIEELEVIIPTLDEQEKIINLHSLLEKYTGLMKKQIDNYAILVNTALSNHLKDNE